VSSFVVASRGQVVLLDPLAPPPGEEVWTRLAARPPTAVVILKPDHVRDIDLFARWFRVPAHGPYLFWKDDVPRTALQPVRPGDELPGGLRALYDGRHMLETPLFLPEQRALVFADGLTAPDGVLRIWWSPTLERGVLPALHAMLELPFERVLVSHGEPVHDRTEFVAALEREPWSRPPG
jgi:hypothetical protein